MEAVLIPHNFSRPPRLSRFIAIAVAIAVAIAGNRLASLCPVVHFPLQRRKPSRRAAQRVELPVEMTAEALIVDSTNRMGPEPSHVPKDLWVVLGLRLPPPSPPPWEGSRSLGVAAEIEFSGSAFNVSPPPSSVPLPNFPLMRKLNCNVQAAAGIDAGATDNLRRLLRLR
ncbi:hypothetical protein SDJN03_18265, partial [Cucurbita argyrosperma subsp. sororia]